MNIMADAHSLYRLDFTDGKSYIGITKFPSIERFKSHQHRALKLGWKNAVSEAWRRLGTPTLVVLAIVEAKMRDATERAAIAAYGTLTPGGYNETSGGFSGYKIADSAQERHPKFMSEEAKEKIRRKRLGWVPSAETRAKIGAATLGRKHSEETKKKMSASAVLARARRKEQAARAAAASSNAGAIESVNTDGNLNQAK